jgi:hypothetical protein
MVYQVELDERTVVPYLLALELSPQGRAVMLAAIEANLGEGGDTFIASPERRLHPGSDCFRVDLIFREPATRQLHQIHLIVSDAPAPFGVLRVVFAEAYPGPPSSGSHTDENAS